MPEMLSSKDIIRVLNDHGFILVSQKGSHKKFKAYTPFLQQSRMQLGERNGREAVF